MLKHTMTSSHKKYNPDYGEYDDYSGFNGPEYDKYNNEYFYKDGSGQILFDSERKRNDINYMLDEEDARREEFLSGFDDPYEFDEFIEPEEPDESNKPNEFVELDEPDIIYDECDINEQINKAIINDKEIYGSNRNSYISSCKDRKVN